MNKGMIIVLAVIICTTFVQGFPMFKRRRCHCIDTVKAVKVTDIEKISIIQPSINCDKIEMIITLKAPRRQRCLNPRSKQAKAIIKNNLKKVND
ncbi:C-X-C motif chemokine 11 [Sorex araneus]|uniref:C-X-C motif chemokine 11 n=1 Tax=Sorex araneus TaxID=42254 RepID=UPI00064A9920|nr:C-X-C motif chemokine 11 [Sorex araneus]